MKLKAYILSVALASAAVTVTTSCEDMLDKGNDYVIYADDHSLTTPADTVTSVLGIINKLQAIAVRTNLFGEVRADLVKVNSNATSDLKALATGDVDDDNAYNVPSDYYAVINNCNYYLANVDAEAGNTNRNEKYFDREIAQVHSIRAWTYLQLVLVYGKVPLVVDPVLTKLQSEASYPLYDLAGICQYFIDDLAPYYATEYPDYNTIGGDIDPQLCFFPTQVVTGDLYLYLAAATQDPEAAKSAAKAYYDYILWDLSGKTNLYMQNTHWYWSAATMTNGNYRTPSATTNSSSTWGSTYCDDVTKIPMDSASADGYYNELRNLYNTTYVTSYSEASISPSDSLIALSEAQEYVDIDSNKDTITVSADKLDDDAIENHYLGDLRFQKDYSTRTVKSGSQEYEYQTISKHNSQHISIYRATQIYLRLAEALNYAGYPRFARQILTMGLSNNVITNEVSPYYTSDEDASFIDYFQFLNTSFVPYATSYTQSKDVFGNLASVSFPLNESTSSCNMWGVHSRGSGLAFLNKNYCPLTEPDYTDYPTELAEAVPTKPTAPTVVEKPDSLSYEEWAATATIATEARYEKTYLNGTYAKAVEAYETYVEEYATYQADSTVYANALAAFMEKYTVWYDYQFTNVVTPSEQKTVDQAILDEQALELSYEGNRFYDVMRRALWWNNPALMSETFGVSKYSSKSGWFISWDGQIGFDIDDEAEE